MRVSAVGHMFDRLEDVLAQAARSAEVTHNHPEGIKAILGPAVLAVGTMLGKYEKFKDAPEPVMET